MSTEAAGPAPMMNLAEFVHSYVQLAGGFGKAVALSAFGLTPDETHTVFSGFDEDYHISRFLHFSCAEGQSYTISGEPVTHVMVDRDIESLL
jgi:hypothetical protein